MHLSIFFYIDSTQFSLGFKVILYSVDQMREYLKQQYGYSLDHIPISLGGTFDPVLNGHSRYQMCLAKVTNHHSICYQYYSLDYQSQSTKLTNDNVVSHTNDHNQDKSTVPLRQTSISSPSSFLGVISLRHKHESSSLPSSSSKIRIRKRESSSSSDNDKRQRANANLIEEELSVAKSSSLFRKENFDK